MLLNFLKGDLSFSILPLGLSPSDEYSRGSVFMVCDTDFAPGHRCGWWDSSAVCSLIDPCCNGFPGFLWLGKDPAAEDL